MNNKDVEKIAYIIKDLPEEIQERFFSLDSRIEEEITSSLEVRFNIDKEFQEKRNDWIRIAKKNGAVACWGNSVVIFQGDTPEIKKACVENAQIQYKKIHGKNGRVVIISIK